MNFSPLQLELLQKYKEGRFSHWTTNKDVIDAFSEIIDEAERLERELNAFDESGDDLILWFCKKNNI